MMFMLVMAGLLARDAQQRKTTACAGGAFPHMSQKRNAEKHD
jgi:hypothetical protein